MSAIQNIAAEVVTEVSSPKEQKAFDFTLLNIIIEAITLLIAIWKWKHPTLAGRDVQQLAGYAGKNPLERAVLKARVKRSMRARDVIHHRFDEGFKTTLNKLHSTAVPVLDQAINEVGTTYNPPGDINV